MAKAPRFCHGFNSCAVESQHNKRTKYANKRQFFPSSFPDRARLAVLDHNMGDEYKLAVCDRLGIALDEHRRETIQRDDQARLTALAKKRSDEVKVRTAVHNWFKQRERIINAKRNAPAPPAPYQVRNDVASDAPSTTVPTAPRADSSAHMDDDDGDKYDTKYDQ